VTFAEERQRKQAQAQAERRIAKRERRLYKLAEELFTRLLHTPPGPAGDALAATWHTTLQWARETEEELRRMHGESPEEAKTLNPEAHAKT
jgi:hypothetical protein